MNSKLTNIPSWARARVQRMQSLTKGDESKAGALTRRDFSPSDTVAWVRRNREIMGEARADDENPERDEALGQKGLVKQGNQELRYTGNARQGQIEIVSDDRVSLIELNGTATTRIDVLKDGRSVASRTDLAKPNEGVQWGGEPQPRDLPPSEFANSTISAAQLLKDQDESSLFRQVYLEGKVSMTEVRGELTGQLKKGVGKLSSEQAKQLQTLLDKPDANTARRMGIALQKLRQENPNDKSLKELSETAGTWQALEDFPKLQADGLMRNSINYVSPVHFATQTAAQGWDFDKKSGLPIADSVVVGGGPGGLSSAYHLSENGHRTVVLEGGHTGQAFSDNGAASVHQLRTNVEQSNLIYTPNANHLGIDVSMTRHRDTIPLKAKKAREEWTEATGEENHGSAEANGSFDHASNRGDLFEHMSMISQGLATKYPDTFVIENSPVTNIEASKGENGERLFKLTTERGHQMMSRSLVMATGFVGTAGEHARTLKQFGEMDSAPGVTVLGSDHDLVSKNDRVEKDSLVFSDRLLGRPEIRKRLKELPKGSRLAVVGGGESAAKGALEALHLNPGLNVDIYTNQPFEPYQTQIPVNALSSLVAEAGLKEPDIAQKTLDDLKPFKTPIVTSTMRQLLEFESVGRLRIKEMGKRFNQDTVEVKPKDGGGFAMTLKDQEVKANLREQRQDWQAMGLYGSNPPQGPPDQLPDADMVMTAVGYDKRSCQAGPLVQQLVDQGVIEMKDGEVAMGADGLTSAKDPMVAFNTAAVQKMAGDSALPGRAIRAYRLGRYFEEKLPAREKPVDAIGKGLKFNEYIDTNRTEETFEANRDIALGFMESGGLFPEFIQHREERVAGIQDPLDREYAAKSWQAQKDYPNRVDPLREMRYRELDAPETLSPVDKLMLKRAASLRERL